MERPHHQEVAVAVFPFPSQSHLNQILHLSNLIASYGLPVHFIGSATHNRQVKLRANGLKPNKIHFHDFSTLSIDTPDPDPNASDKLPMQISPAIRAYANFSLPLCSFFQELSTKYRRLVVIHDRQMAEALEDSVSIMNIEFYSFSCISAFNLFNILWQFKGKPFDIDWDARVHEIMPPVDKILPEFVLKLMATRPEHFKNRAGDIYNSSRLIEGKYIDLLSREELGGKDKNWAINPIFPRKQLINSNRADHECMKWLDRQNPRSVIYVSFGNCVSLSDEEAREIAVGLEESKTKFLWVLRDADRADIFVKEARKIQLPEGFEERVGENGGWV